MDGDTEPVADRGGEIRAAQAGLIDEQHVEMLEDLLSQLVRRIEPDDFRLLVGERLPLRVGSPPTMET